MNLLIECFRINNVLQRPVTVIMSSTMSYYKNALKETVSANCNDFIDDMAPCIWYAWLIMTILYLFSSTILILYLRPHVPFIALLLCHMQELII